MINLMPPELKSEIRFSKRNRLLVKYMLLTLGVAGAMSLLMFSGVFFAKQQLNSVDELIANKEESIKHLRKTEGEAREIDDKLQKIDKLFDQQSYYSAFLDELGEYVPSWASITTITFKRSDDTTDGKASKDTEDPKRLVLQMSVSDADRVPALRDILLDMPRIDFIDIQNFSGDKSGGTTTFVVALNTEPHIPLSESEESPE